MKNNLEKLLILSFSRSGSNFLGINCSQWMNTFTSIKHRIEDYDPETPTVSCFRDPKNAIASMLYVSSKYDKRIDLDVADQIKKYNQINEFILSKGFPIVDFNKLIKDPIYIIKKIGEILDVSLKEYPIQYTIDRPETSFIATSRNNNEFELFETTVKNHPDSAFDRSYELYYQALEKAI